ncbi:paeninodin family lasso peptide [Paenibacillus tarimensis]
MQKKEWQTPELEVLNVSETMAGWGLTKVDFTYVNGKLVDADIYS